MSNFIKPDWINFDWSTLSMQWGCSCGSSPQSVCQTLREARDSFIKFFEKQSSEFDPFKHERFDEEIWGNPSTGSKSDHSKALPYLFEMTTGLFLNALSKKEGNKEEPLSYMLQKTPNKVGLPDLLLETTNRHRLWVECVLPQKGNVNSMRSVPYRTKAEPPPCCRSKFA